MLLVEKQISKTFQLTTTTKLRTSFNFCLYSCKTLPHVELKKKLFLFAVLPAFDIKIKMENHFILPTDEDFTFTIKAEYSYIQPVFGSYYVKVSLVRSVEKPVVVYKKPARLNERVSVVLLV